MATYEIVDGHRYKIEGSSRVLVDLPEVRLIADRLKAPADGATQITITLTAIGPDAGIYAGDVTLVLQNTGKQYTASMTAGVLTFRLTSTVVFDPTIFATGGATSLNPLRLVFGEPPALPGFLGEPLKYIKTGNLIAIESDETDDATAALPLSQDARDRLLQEAVKGIRALLARR